MTDYAPKDINPDYALNGINALRRAADMAEASACGDRVDAGLVLLARMAERLVQGTLCEDECLALVAVLRG